MSIEQAMKVPCNVDYGYEKNTVKTAGKTLFDKAKRIKEILDSGSFLRCRDLNTDNIRIETCDKTGTVKIILGKALVDYIVS